MGMARAGLSDPEKGLSRAGLGAIGRGWAEMSRGTPKGTERGQRKDHTHQETSTLGRKVAELTREGPN